MDGRLIGAITATVTLILLGFALGLFSSERGLLIAGIIAVAAGAGAGAVAEPRRSGRNSAVVAGYVAILILAYILGQTAGRYAPTGSRGAPGVMPPP